MKGLRCVECVWFFKKMHPEYLLRPLNSLKPSFLTSFALPWFSLGCLAHMCVGTCEEPGRPVFPFSRREVVRFYVKSKWEIAGTAFCRVSQRGQSLSQLVYIFAYFLLKGSVAIASTVKNMCLKSLKAVFRKLLRR